MTATGPRPPVAVTIAGTDPSGGAGIQADLKTFTARGAYGASIITALVAQNTHGVSRIYEIDHDFVIDQFDSVVDDIHIDATKSGMLGTPELVQTTADYAAAGRLGFLVVDPVMVATSGHRLLAENAIDAVRTVLLPQAGIITPNLPEAALLLGDDEPEAGSPAQMREQAARLLKMGPKAVLLKGGHGADDIVTDILAVAEGDDIAWREFSHPRVFSPNTHGTGCTLSAAIAAEVAHRRHALAQAGEDPSGASTGEQLGDAVGAALDYLARAIGSAADWQLALNPDGAHGPVDHIVDITR